MLTLVIFTFRRLELLNSCIDSINSNTVNEVLIFNDDESRSLGIEDIKINHKCQIYNPKDFGLKGRKFRKPIYFNKAIEFAKNDAIIFSDDDGVFTKGCIDQHARNLNEFKFTAGAIIRDKFLKRKSKSILQGTNYGFRKEFLKAINGYDEKYIESGGGGDPEMWFRIYNHVKEHNVPVAYLKNAIQTVLSKQSRKKTMSVDPKNLFQEKHGFSPKGPMYRWFPEIRDKSKWMRIISK